MAFRFVLVSATHGGAWAEVLRARLALLGDMDCITQDGIGPEVSQYAMAFVDSTEVTAPGTCVARLLSGAQSTQVVVLTASPTWRRAREMFEAGAVDYLSKSMPQAEFLAAVEAILRRGGEGKGDQDRQ